MLVVEVANGRSLVWGAEAVQALRERLGVGGRTVGALPRGPRQNSRLGLPLLLMPEEARLLAEIGAVTLVSAPRPDPRHHGLALASFKRQQEQGFQEQSALAAEARETRRQELLEKIAEGRAAKKQKLEQDSGASGSQEAGGSQAAGEDAASASQASGQEEAGPSSPQPGPSNGVTPLPRSALLVQLATARPRPVKARPLDWRVQSKDWPHAGRPAHELRYSIYRDLWEKGFFLSAAGKFGGDFLVYPGDPLRFHAHYIAQCWAAGDPIPLQDLVSAGRLGTSVRKTLLLCSPQPDGKVVYTSLQWVSLQ
ncbi:tRNA-splicing endonuclease subunit Sen34 [Choloepus didactylus]|uniref:tRNA-splicing endonuclease subunit Sen34 n=1 Tax=Choloepus didactylus TaxID=27675 RepID=UPI0018A083D4|nr:tRNA-splicing endonuclease subunit Sen34 [Choloepus didactylus]XP_037676372.1 tRNA-splicing endonuclease subunit Sen34 [Choloepus didactylus]